MRDADPLIRGLQRHALAWTALATLAAIAIRPRQPSIAGGIAGGGLLALTSLWAIRGSVDALVSRLAPSTAASAEDARSGSGQAGAGQAGAGQAGAGAGLAVKLVGRYALLGLGAYVMIARLRLHPVGLLIGASSLVAGACIEAGRSLRRP
jgi:hypothetical protein